MGCIMSYFRKDNDDLVCYCYGVTLGEICQAFENDGARTPVDIQNLTQASTGCGSCFDEVEEILKVLKEKHAYKG